MGSNTPRTDVRVGPIRRVAMASVSIEIIVGNTARPVRLIMDFKEFTPFMKETSLVG